MLSQILLWNVIKISNKFYKIWLKWLNPRILKDEKLNWFKVSKWTNSKIHLKKKAYLTL